MVISPEEFTSKVLQIEEEIGKVIVGQKDVIRQVIICLLAGGECPAGGGAGARENHAGTNSRTGPFPEIFPYSVHSRFNAGRHCRYPGADGRAGTAAVRFPGGTGVCQPGFGG